MMGQTFAEDQEDMHRIWFFPFASLVLQYEAVLNKAQRERYRIGRKSRCLFKFCSVAALSLHRGPVFRCLCLSSPN